MQFAAWEYTDTSYELIHYERPWTVNAERSMHHMERARHVRQWRAAFAALALEAELPRPFPGPVIIGCMPLLRDNRTQDCGACYPALKAAVDGLVDAGVLQGDGPEWVKSYVMVTPHVNSEVGDGMAITIGPYYES